MTGISALGLTSTTRVYSPWRVTLTSCRWGNASHGSLAASVMRTGTSWNTRASCAIGVTRVSNQMPENVRRAQEFAQEEELVHTAARSGRCPLDLHPTAELDHPVGRDVEV